MFVHFGHPLRLTDIGRVQSDVADLKRRFRIGVLDDEPFVQADALRAHGFQLVELGGDIKSVEQVEAYPIVICDIKGVGRAFGSKYEGAHVLSEIRKAYPDKYLVAFTGMTYDASYNEKLNTADKSATKDAPIDLWTQTLETALLAVGDPRERWIRLRPTLLNRGVELFDLLMLEQAFIRAIRERDARRFNERVRSLPISTDITDVLIKFSAAALVQLIEAAVV